MKYVLALSVGPVGRFISAGRRSRDLWYGSTWLSETTRKVAKLVGDGCSLRLGGHSSIGLGRAHLRIEAAP